MQIVTVPTSGVLAGKTSGVTIAGWAALLVLPPAVYLVALASRLSTQSSIFAALLSATVLMWMFSLVDEFVPPLVAIVAALIIGLAPPTVALAGFSSPSMLLLLGVFALSAVISFSGLSYRLILRLLLRLPDGPFWHQAALLISGYLLSPLMPSANARLSLLTPVYKDMVAGLQLPRRGPAVTALLASMFGGAVLFGPMMVTSKSSNIAAITFLPIQLQAEFGGFFWLVAAAVAAATITAAHFVVVRVRFQTNSQATMSRADIRQRLADMGPASPSEWVAAGSFAFFLLGIATVPWHHVKPPYLAGCVLLALLVTGTLGKRDFQSRVDWPMIFFLLGIDSLMRVMDHLGLAQALARVIRRWFDFIDGEIGLLLLATLVVTATLRLVLPVSAGMLTSVAILLPIATAQGINPWVIVFGAAVFSDMSFLPHQGTNGILQMRSAGLLDDVDQRGFQQYNLLMNAARVAAVYASIPWWTFLGLLR